MQVASDANSLCFCNKVARLVVRQQSGVIGQPAAGTVRARAARPRRSAAPTQGSLPRTPRPNHAVRAYELRQAPLG